MHGQATTLPLGSIFARRYRVERLLGRGGMGEVYLVHDTLLRNQALALKLLDADRAQEQEQIDRFLREVHMTRLVAHPHVVRTFDCGQEGSTLYYTMELCEGPSLHQRIASGPVSSEESIRILHQTALGMSVIHAAGIVHRDLKPSNVVLHEGSTVKIADFGIATPGTRSITHGGDILGTAAYLAPEIWRGEQATARSDIYAFGILGYELLSGAPPFVGRSIAQSMHDHLKVAPPPLAERTKAPAWLVELVERSLSKDPSARHRSMVEIAASIEAESAGTLGAPASRRTLARRPAARRWFEIPQRLSRRTALGALTTAALFVLVLAAGVARHGVVAPALPASPPPPAGLIAFFASDSLQGEGAPSEWSTSVPRSFSFVQSDPARRPTTTAGPHGSVLTFDGEDDVLFSEPLAEALRGSQALTVIAVERLAIGKHSTLWALHQHDREQNIVRLVAGSVGHLDVRALSWHEMPTHIWSTEVVPLGELAIYSAVLTQDEVRAYCNGRELIRQSLPHAPHLDKAGIFTLGADWDHGEPNELLSGNVAALAVFGRALDPEERSAYEAALGARYSVALAKAPAATSVTGR